MRCALCNDEYTTEIARKHNNANIIALGSRLINFEKAKKILDIYLNTEFEGERHLARINKIDN